MKVCAKWKSSRGFTLIELVAVITILAILATAVTGGVIAIARSATQNNNKSAVRSYFTLCKAAMGQLNSGTSIYSNGTFTSNSDITTLIKRTTGKEPALLLRLEDDQSTDKYRPFASDKEGYYVCIRYADPALTYPISSNKVTDANRVFFVDAVYFVSDKVCYAYTRGNSEVVLYK